MNAFDLDPNGYLPLWRSAAKVIHRWWRRFHHVETCDQGCRA